MANIYEIEVNKNIKYKFMVDALSEKDAINKSIDLVENGKLESLDGSVDFDFTNITLVSNID